MRNEHSKNKIKWFYSYNRKLTYHTNDLVTRLSYIRQITVKELVTKPPLQH
jgi:hypothetical protein